ncbi:MAG: phage tail length tape measure family protein, partial [Spirochaetaceae bacterium]|nr:phage tail length tape measure family protein [Spirochaetaceae bacterium]
MADLSLKIKADFLEAVRQFEELAAASEETRKKIEDYGKSFDSQKEVTAFITKQKLAQAAITATRGPADALKTVIRDYGKQIETLIKNGLSPESEHIQKLTKEYDALKEQAKELTAAKKTQASSTGSLKDQLMNMVPGLAAAAAAYHALSGAISAAKQFAEESLQAYRRQEESNARLATVIQATGASAWTTAAQMKDFSRELASSTGKSVQEIQDMNAVLLGFRSITGDVFEDASAAIVQMSGVMGGDLQSAANSFGKALDTPIEGMASLSRYGFVFTEEEKEQVKVLEEAGKHMEAQNIILDAMTGSFGDAATAVNQAALSQNNFETAIENLKAACGKPLEEAIRPLRDFCTGIIDGAAGAVRSANDTNDALERLSKMDYAVGLEGQIQ